MSRLLLFPVAQSDKNKLDQAYEVAEDFKAVYEGKDIWVPQFFQYDGASIPSLGWQIIGTPFNPHFMEAAVIHDWLYHSHQLEKKDADKLFYKILLENNVDPVKAVLMREAVEKFGDWYWKNDEEDSKYIEKLKNKIIESGREPSKYGL